MYLTKVWVGRKHWWYFKTKKKYRRRYRKHFGIASYKIAVDPDKQRAE